jgi:hypothetical protein
LTILGLEQRLAEELDNLTVSHELALRLDLAGLWAVEQVADFEGRRRDALDLAAFVSSSRRARQ